MDVKAYGIRDDRIARAARSSACRPRSMWRRPATASAGADGQFRSCAYSRHDGPRHTSHGASRVRALRPRAALRSCARRRDPRAIPGDSTEAIEVSASVTVEWAAVALSAPSHLLRVAAIDDEALRPRAELEGQASGMSRIRKDAAGHRPAVHHGIGAGRRQPLKFRVRAHKPNGVPRTSSRARSPAIIRRSHSWPPLNSASAPSP